MFNTVSRNMRITRLLVTAGTLALASITMGQAPTAALPPAARPTAPLVVTPSVDTLQKYLDDKQYPQAVKEASKLLALHGRDAAGLSRFQITLMKGYGQVGSKLTAAGIETFKSAQKETTDPHELALAKWTAELFQRSRGPLYVPKVNGAGAKAVVPIDLLQAERRTQAFIAMLDDDLAMLGPRIKVASTSLNLAKIWPVIHQVKDLAELDLIGTGNQDKVNAVAGALLDHSRNLLTSALKGMWIRTADIETHANIVSTNTILTQDALGNAITQTASSRNGLTDANRQDLANIIATCVEICDAAQAFGPLSLNDNQWLAILADSDRVSGRASDVLNTQYGGSTSASDTSLSAVNPGDLSDPVGISDVQPADALPYQTDGNGFRHDRPRVEQPQPPVGTPIPTPPTAPVPEPTKPPVLTAPLPPEPPRPAPPVHSPKSGTNQGD